MTTWQLVLLATYGVTLGLLLVFSAHRFVMVRLYYRNADRVPTPPSAPATWPTVTVQLPLYNEYYVAERLIRSVAVLDYPAGRLEIQVLDDSTDETSGLVDRCVEELVLDGVDVKVLRRASRDGFKAGALTHGLRRAKGELVAVFDADFVPRPDFLKRTVPHFSQPDVGMVQARWGHLNRDYSLLTRVQAIFLDGHFVMEHGARSRSGLFFNFNGTAGVWRRTSIDDAGGWQHDTLTEDLDLSYRAQMAGWRFVFLQEVEAPAELPITTRAWKSQQFRWAKGSVQTARKLLGPMLRSPAPWQVKVEAAMHMCANVSYLLLAVLALLMFPAVHARGQLGVHGILLVDVPLFLGATTVVSRFYLLAQKELHADWSQRVRYIPAALAVGMGTSLNNARAVLEALFGHRSAFQRTPKFNVIGCDGPVNRARYGTRRGAWPYLETGMGLYLVFVLGYAISTAAWLPVLFLALFASGFLYIGLSSLGDGRPQDGATAEPMVEAAAAD